MDIRFPFALRPLAALLVFMVAFPAALLPALDASSAARARIVNQLSGGHTLVTVFTSPSDSTDWGPDLLAGQGIGPGQFLERRVYFPKEKALFDILAVDETGTVYHRESVEITDGVLNVLEVNDSHRVSRTHADFTLVEVNFLNRGALPLDSFFLAPSDTATWGFELTDPGTPLAPGGRLGSAVPVPAGQVRLEGLGTDTSGTESGLVIVLTPEDSNRQFLLGK